MTVDRERLANIVSDSLAAATEGTDWAESPPFSDEPGSPYVLRLTNEIASRIDRGPAHPGEGHDFDVTCRKCGDSGRLFVAFTTPGEVVRIETPDDIEPRQQDGPAPGLDDPESTR